MRCAVQARYQATVESARRANQPELVAALRHSSGRSVTVAIEVAERLAYPANDGRTHMTSTEISEEDIAALIAGWSQAAQLIMNGDLRGYAAIARHAEDFTLLPPNGGDARAGFDGSDDAVEWWARTFREGQARLEVVTTYSSGDLAVLVAVERQVGTVGDLPPQDWSLRVTLVFRREETGWRLVHRHADPLVRPLNPELFAAIARGEHSL